MSKQNSLYNYFTSPKNPKPAAGRTPATKNKDVDKVKPASKSKSTTPKRGTKPAKVKDESPKEKKNTPAKKRPLKERNGEEDAAPEKPKRRRIIIPDESDNEDSEDDYKPESAEEESEDDTALSEASEEESTMESEEGETPEKKGKRTKAANTRATNKKSKTDNTNSTDNSVVPNEKPSFETTWRHLEYDFIKPENIRDINKRRPSDPDYDPRTLHVPPNFLNEQTPGMRQWWVLKSKHWDCVIFFKVGKFYELYHMDAVIGVTVLGLSYMKGGFAHSGFPEIAYGRFSVNLVERGYKVARVEQTETPDMASERCKKSIKTTKFDKVVRREICQVSSRGTRIFTPQDSEALTPQSNFLMSLIEKRDLDTGTSSYGVCFLDTTIGEFHLGEFQDDRNNSRLLTLFSHHPPVQIIYERGNLSETTMKILSTMLTGTLKDSLLKESQFWSATTTLKNLHEADYFKNSTTGEIEWPEGLKSYLCEADVLGLTPADDKQLAINALGGCIFVLKDSLLEQQLLGQKRFHTYVPPDSVQDKSKDGLKSVSNVVVDAVTINNLKVLGEEGSLITTLDHCCTAFGKRLLREWVCRPPCQKTLIIQRQNAITELLDQPDIVQTARGILANLSDLERLLSKIHSYGNASKAADHPDSRAIFFEKDTYNQRKIVDFISILESFDEALKLTALFKDCTSDLIKSCTRPEPDGDFPDLSETLQFFKVAFDHEDAKKNGCIMPKHGVDAEYDSTMLEIEQIEKDAKTYLRSLTQRFDCKVTFVGSDKKRYQIEIPDSRVKKIGEGFELQSQRKGFKRYYTSESKDLLSRMMNAEDQKEKILKDINRRIFAKFSEKYDLWAIASYRIAIIDVLISITEYTRSGNMCIPEIIDGEEVMIDIKDGKHPSIVSENFVPNDTAMGTEGAAPLMILTGPNMGGKSTLMRQVGLITIMAHMGCHVPASSCRLSLVDRIFTRLGANDDILAAQSTFFVELSETSTILQHATPHSLVLLDELGRGTSTYDGTAIAAAVVDALTKLKCRTLFSTHYHSLVEDYKTNPNVSLTHMACMVENEEEELTQETVTFLYKLSDGPCPKSYGFNAARLARVPHNITKRAHDISVKFEREVKQKHLFIALCNAADNSIKELVEAVAAM